jgi:hypothetical protein
MHRKEASDLQSQYPLIGHVLRIIKAGGMVDPTDPLYSTYLIIRQRGLVCRNPDSGQVQVSEKGRNYSSLLKK